VNVPDTVHYWYWCETMAHPQRRRAEHIGISPLGLLAEQMLDAAALRELLAKKC
jgi:hypothetical protein